MTAPLLGIVADDLTGACDVAAAATDAGLHTVVSLGPPSGTPLADCIVVALKSRTAEPGIAVRQSLESGRWLLGHGTARLYQKYCSTFDSTDRGNIGPVAEALASIVAERAGTPDAALSIGTPATPQNGRTQYLGHLFVGDRLLSESPLRDHPLTPMGDPDLVRVLARQSTRSVGLLPHPVVRAGGDGLRAALRRLADSGAGHVLVDALDDDDLDRVAAALLAGDGPPALLGGGAGLAGALARRIAESLPADREGAALAPAVPAGRRLLLSGSASARTREQVAAFPGHVRTLDPLRLADGSDSAETVLSELAGRFAGHPDDTVLVSATADPDRVRAVQAQLGTAAAAELVERELGRIAVGAVDDLGVRRLLVAGGETSGAVADALGVRSLFVGRSAAPGVPWTVAGHRDGRTGADPIALLLKSGNFGGPDLFSTAWEVAP
ncbi:3-oxo-tetronate kinase [Lysobacter korlensis]|uniref:3-oxo-tetronate kinase n=1 Tax=Lysobacter korlensis TaxID=553636 RepID=A0ABV6RVW5_9GAMM